MLQLYEKSDSARVTLLLHSAVFVGGGLFFEKPNTEDQESDSPYRLADAKTVTQSISTLVDGKMRAAIYRPKEFLRPPEEQFGAGLGDTLVAYEKAQGRPVGMPLLNIDEPSSGGGVLGQYLTALATVPLVEGADGRTHVA